MIYYLAEHTSQRAGSDWTHFLKAKNLRGLDQMLRHRMPHWKPGDWNIYAVPEDHKYTREMWKRVRVMYVRVKEAR